jgi:hypothetical protein
MRCRNDTQAAILEGHVVQHQQRGYQIIIRMWRVGKILVIADLSIGTGKLQVDLAVVKLHIRADQVGDHVHHGRMQHYVPERRRDIRGIVYPSKSWAVWPVLRAKIETWPAINGRFAKGSIEAAALFHPSGDLASHPFELQGGNGVLNNQNTLFPVSGDLTMGQNRTHRTHSPNCLR